MARPERPKVHSIAFVLTKVEDSPAWRELLAENRDRLATFVSRAVADGALDPDLGQRLREAPWIPVSAKLGEAAAHVLAHAAVLLADAAGLGDGTLGTPLKLGEQMEVLDIVQRLARHETLRATEAGAKGFRSPGRGRRTDGPVTYHVC